MPRLCERPGCFAPAAVVYGMEHEQLMVWLDVVPERGSLDHGLICRRHADAMVVPRGWTLDDRREPRPRLFKVVDVTGRANEPKRAQRPKPALEGEPSPQLDFDDLVTSREQTQAIPWAPVFDEDDDLDGLLRAKSPLLSRAFRSAGLRTAADS